MTAISRQMHMGVFVLGTGGGKVMGTEGNLRLLRKIRPDVIIGMPTFLYHVLTEAVDTGDGEGTGAGVSSVGA